MIYIMINTMIYTIIYTMIYIIIYTMINNMIYTIIYTMIFTITISLFSTKIVLSLLLSCLYQPDRATVQVQLFGTVTQQRSLETPQQRVFSYCGCQSSRHHKPPTHLQSYCLFWVCRVEQGSVWLYGLWGDMMVRSGNRTWTFCLKEQRSNPYTSNDSGD